MNDILNDKDIVENKYPKATLRFDDPRYLDKVVYEIFAEGSRAQYDYMIKNGYVKWDEEKLRTVLREVSKKFCYISSIDLVMQYTLLALKGKEVE